MEQTNDGNPSFIILLVIIIVHFFLVEEICGTTAPPTWEDVMNEKKSELQSMQTNHQGKESNDFIQLEKREINKETAKEEAIRVENDEKLTCIQNFLATLQRILKILKAIAMWCTLTSDVVLWVRDFALL